MQNGEKQADSNRPENQGSALQNGILYLVGTPIGNLQDISERVVNTLAEADWIAAEDTRRTLQLLNHLGLKKHLISCHQHNQKQRIPLILEKLKQGGKVALVTDAGMPGISDPGTKLVAACVDAGIDVTAIPGPSAFLVALAASGLDTDRFVFEGFIHSSGKLRKQRIQELSSERRTVVLYEAPHRVIKTLKDLEAEGLSERRLTLARELTKKYESFWRTTVGEAVRQADQMVLRGEFVLVLEGLDSYSKRCADGNRLKQEKEVSDWSEEDAILQIQSLLEQGFSIKDAVLRLSGNDHLSRNEWYRLALRVDERRKMDDSTET